MYRLIVLATLGWSIIAFPSTNISFDELKQQYATVLNGYCKDQYSDGELDGRVSAINNAEITERVAANGLQAGWNDHNPYKAHWQWLRCDYAVFNQRLTNPQLLGAILKTAILLNDIELVRMLLHNEHTDSQESLAHAASALKAWCNLQEEDPDNSDYQQACQTAKRMHKGLQKFHERKQAQRG